MWEYNNHLVHHGILGQKWGVRRYQYEDGTLTSEGKKRYYESNADSDRYARQGAKVGNAYADYLNSSKLYYNSETGNTILIEDLKKKATYERAVKEADDILEKLEKNYEVFVDGFKVSDSGKSFIQVALKDKKFGKIYCSALETEFKGLKFYGQS